MGEYDIGQTTTTALDTGVDDYNVDSGNIDESSTKETYWYNSEWNTYLGYFDNVPEINQAVIALARWTVGKGYTAENPETEIILENINGWGEDTIDSIFMNQIITKWINGDSYAEIILSDNGDLINLKPLNPANIRHVMNDKGIIIRYDKLNHTTRTYKSFQPEQILHLCNNRIANQIHGTSAVKACKWVVDARNEAMADWRRISHRSTIRVLYVDEDDTTQLSTYKTQYKDAINKGELLIIPAKAGEKQFQELTLPPIANFLEWIRYLENIFYQSIGVPKIILGGAQEFTEASSKIGYLTFEQVYMSEQRLLEQDLWNQLGIKIKFERPVSLKENVQESEEKNTGQEGFQPAETEPAVTRSE